MGETGSEKEESGSERAQLTLSISKENKEKLRRIAKQKGMTMAGVLASWIADYKEKID